MKRKSSTLRVSDQFQPQFSLTRGSPSSRSRAVLGPRPRTSASTEASSLGSASITFHLPRAAR